MALCTRKGIDFLWRLLTFESSLSLGLFMRTKTILCKNGEYPISSSSLQTRLFYNQWSVIPDFQIFYLLDPRGGRDGRIIGRVVSLQVAEVVFVRGVGRAFASRENKRNSL